MAENSMKALLDKVAGDPAYVQKLETMSQDELRQWVEENKIEENIDDLAKAMSDYVGQAAGPAEISEDNLDNVAGGVDRQDIYRGCEAVYKSVRAVFGEALDERFGPKLNPVFGTGGFQR